jgi:GrpB-like predicted nucleotidyltransferase (UPF0157 family)/ubiquinone/menaquinone biosynthesis C-methylase UbiE
MIEIVPYDPDWPASFDAERRRIADALGALALRIEHNGSTAVPGLSAKPIIDIQVSVSRLRPIDQYRPALEALGYVHVPHADDAFAPFFHRPAEWPHTHHIHVVEAGSAEEERTLAFRDFLCANPDVAREYGSFKRKLAAQFVGGGPRVLEQYATAKSAFVNAVVDRALRERQTTRVQHYYDTVEEESRLAFGSAQLEFERTKEMLAVRLPPPPACILDVGGAAGVYSLWLADLGYDVHLVDASARLVGEARQRSAAAAKPVASIVVGDARDLPEESASADTVLVMGPLYHLTAADDRLLALREACRVLRRGGLLAVAGISRYASALAGLSHNLALDPRFVTIRDRDLRDGQHRNDTDNPNYFTSAYFHTPEGLAEEIAAAGFADVQVLGVEGPGWILTDFDERWKDSARRRVILDTARALENAPSIVGASAHLLGVARKR